MIDTFANKLAFQGERNLDFRTIDIDRISIRNFPFDFVILILILLVTSALPFSIVTNIRYSVIIFTATCSLAASGIGEYTSSARHSSRNHPLRKFTLPYSRADDVR